MRKTVFVIVAVLALGAATAIAQGLTGTLTGTVSQGGIPLPGVRVSVSSPNLQGTRDTFTNEAGGYSFGALPPGDYTVHFELAGMQAETHRVKVSVAQTARADAEMKVAAVQEAITVTATTAAVATTTEVQTNFTHDLVDKLPVARGITNITALAPGVTGGVNGNSISGGMSFDNLYTLNGAVIQENLRGQPHPLFIEDAIQETTIQTAGISAEFGNFTGGVVNAITKSGGNEFDGSLRDSLTNPKWTEKSPDAYRVNSAGQIEAVPPPEQVDDLAHQYEATLGGRIIRDRLWFFTAGRHRERDQARTFSNAGGGYTRTSLDERFEAKLTGAITPQHNLVLSHVQAPQTATNDCQIGCYDATALDPDVENPYDFTTLFYNGILTDQFLVEAKYSQVNFAFVGYGGDDPDRITGTPFRLTAPGFSTSVNEPFFCGTCRDEDRNNDTIGLKATYYLGTRSFGSHNIVAGVERWHETRVADNFQTPSGFVFIARSLPPTRSPNGQTLVSIRPGNDYVQIWQIPQTSLGSDLNTDAIYINDKWELGDRWSFNLGARYDANDSIDSAGNKVAEDSKLSPRLGAAFDLFGNGRLRLNASFGTYVGRLAETVANISSSAGNNARWDYVYEGPAISNVPAEDALRQIFAWYDSIGGVTNARLIGQNFPGASTQLREHLDSPAVDEWTFGVASQFNRGFIRADFIRRDWYDFYAAAANMQTGRVMLPGNRPADLTLIYNSDEFQREYNAVELQAAYRLPFRINVGGNYTWSELTGNIVGESSGGGPGASFDATHMPEYRDFPQQNKVGFLTGDQTHKLRAWASIDLPTFAGNFNFSVLQRFDSGDPYSLTGSVDVRQSANFYGTGQPGGVTNPGYVTPPSSVNYYFSDRGEFRFDDLTATDVALNYETNPGWLRGLTFFAQAEVINVFNEDAALSHNTSVLTHLNDPSLRRFNPLAGDVPQEGVHWRRGPLFGLPTSHTTADSSGSFQTPRTYRFSGGIRF